MSLDVYSPDGIDKIWHKGKAGNVYRLDFVKFLMDIRDRLKSSDQITSYEVHEENGEVLKTIHSSTLVDSYRTGEPTDLANSSGILWQPGFYEWIIDLAWSFIQGGEQAIKTNKAVLVCANPGHHAEYDSGFGFCPINGFAIAAKSLLQNKIANKIAILDLDVHYGNGTHSLVCNEPRILSTDIWRYKLDKWKYTNNSENILHINVENVDKYFVALNNIFERIDSFKPDILLYHSGLDVLDSDRMGGIAGFNEEMLIKRETLLGDFLRSKKIPFVIGPGGGYIDHSKSEEDIARQEDRLRQLFIKTINILTNSSLPI